MAFDDRFRLSSHAVICNAAGEVLLLKASYGSQAWGLPGGALEPGETIHQALLRECREELGITLTICYLSGVYYHAQYDSQAFVFRCALPGGADIRLSEEHTAWAWFAPAQLPPVQRRRVEECLRFDGYVQSARFD
ncbi:NUDIX hydrolase [Vogesella sp. XCS3]|uniref:NUDIX hydrolase n=1 Tax=Vogesella sp. XCS3 TaxID=2877939 RepID=UPI001D0B893A|nr:NUDIX domain-containing protein [Vogesella sp. XCS3]UDM17001.1 NUDIX domain-containing protein [Vogesella sp. XCS3]